MYSGGAVLVIQVIAKRLLQSKQTIPHYYLSLELRVDKLLEYVALKHNSKCLVFHVRTGLYNLSKILVWDNNRIIKFLGVVLLICVALLWWFLGCGVHWTQPWMLQRRRILPPRKFHWTTSSSRLHLFNVIEVLNREFLFDVSLKITVLTISCFYERAGCSFGIEEGSRSQ